MATSDATQKELAILIGVDDEQVEQAMQIMLPSLFEPQYKLRVTVKSTAHQIRTASTVYDFDLVLLFINSMVALN